MAQKIEITRTDARSSLNADDFVAQDNIFSITIGKNIDEVFNFCKNLENFSIFMKGMVDVEVLSPVDLHGAFELKSGIKAEIFLQIIKIIPNKVIACKSTESSDIEIESEIYFKPAPSNLGTVVSLSIDYDVPGGKLIEFAAKLTSEDPASLIRNNLRRLKAYLETGEIPTTEGQSSGRESNSEIITKH